MMLSALIVASVMLLPPDRPVQQEAPMLVDVAWLAQHARDANLVLLHIGDRREYDAGHIAGARFISLAEISAPQDRNDNTQLALELPHPDTLRRKLEALGISDDSHIVVYYGNDWVSPATRVIFTLDWIGLGARTSLLNGGMRAWQRAGHAVTADVPAPRPGRLTERTPKRLVVDAAFAAATPERAGHRLVDGRAAVYHRGIEPTYEKSGHIPGALSIPYTTVTDDDLVFDTARLERQFREAGVRPGDTVVGYCHIGQQATAMLFAARLLGHDVLLYDGSFQDWGRNNRGAVEK